MPHRRGPVKSRPGRHRINARKVLGLDKAVGREYTDAPEPLSVKARHDLGTSVHGHLEAQEQGAESLAMTNAGLNIGKLIAESIDHLDKGEIDQALVDVSIAIDATAKREYQAKGKRHFKDFIRQNMQLISRAGTVNITCQAMRFRLKHPDLRPGADGEVGLEDILYELVRCGLLHEGDLPSCIRFGQEMVFANDGMVITLPKHLIFGLILAVVVSPMNSDQAIPAKYVYKAVGGSLDVQLVLNDCWGRRDEVRKVLGIA